MISSRHGRGAGIVRLAIIFVVALLVSSGMAPKVSAQSAPARAGAQADAAGLEDLTLVTRTGRHVFRVEVARTESEREIGLMYRRNLPPNRGMIFEFGAPQPIEMWMKNTYVPLDMIFFSKSGAVTHIARNAEPLSEAIIYSGGPAYSVLEVNAGTADAIGLQVGDKAEHELFKK